MRSSVEETRSLAEANDKHNADVVYEAGMRANGELYERLGMDPERCTALKELSKDKVKEAERQGQVKLGTLIPKLLEQGRTDDIKRASEDEIAA